jgi:hypothetical protein
MHPCNRFWVVTFPVQRLLLKWSTVLESNKISKRPSCALLTVICFVIPWVKGALIAEFGEERDSGKREMFLNPVKSQMIPEKTLKRHLHRHRWKTGWWAARKFVKMNSVTRAGRFIGNILAAVFLGPKEREQYCTRRSILMPDVKAVTGKDWDSSRSRRSPWCSWRCWNEVVQESVEFRTCAEIPDDCLSTR